MASVAPGSAVGIPRLTFVNRIDSRLKFGDFAIKLVAIVTTTRKIIKSFASIKLGTLTLVALAGLTAWGTFVEAQYNDAGAARRIVYHSIWMNITMGAMALTLIAVMVDRWPWQKRHTGFLLAHVGILILMVGSLITKYLGIDGSMSVAIGESGRQVLIDQTVLAAYASMPDVAGFRKVGEAKVDFFKQRPSREKPYTMPLAGGDLHVIEYHPYAFREDKILPSARESAGSGVRFQLQNSRVSLTEWLVQPGPGREVRKDLGPAEVVLASDVQVDVQGRNMIVLRPLAGDKGLSYEIHTAREPKKVKRGQVRPGDTIETGWMGLVLRVLQYLPRAEEQFHYRPAQASTPVTTAVIRVVYAGQEHWVGLNSMMKLFTDQAAYILTFGNVRADVGFDLNLKDFKIGRYQGTMRAATYESVVEVPDLGERVISMNEPLKHNGFTFYQASFQEDEKGRPVMSVFSVNRDPGRWIKYLGSALIVAGTIHLFYFRRKMAKASQSA